MLWAYCLLFLLSGILVLNPFHTAMAHQLKDLASRLKKSGVFRLWIRGRRNLVRVLIPTRGILFLVIPVNDIPVSDVEVTMEINLGLNSIPLSRKRIREDPDAKVDKVEGSGALVKKATMEKAPKVPVPQTLKVWIASLLAEDRRRELFEYMPLLMRSVNSEGKILTSS